MKTEESPKPPIKRQQRTKATAATTGTSRRGRGPIPPVVEAGLMPESELNPLVNFTGLLEPQQPKTTAKGRSRKGLGSPASSNSAATPAKGKSRRSGPNNNNPSAQLPSASPPSVNTRTRTTAEGPDGGGNSGGANNSPIPTRRIFTPAFKRAVLNAFASDPECIGNQRATARKFGVHRRQVQKWLRQDTDSLDKDKESSSDEPHPNSEDRPLNSQDSTVIPEPSDPENSRVISPSSSPSSSQVDLCEMSTAAMALSLNLSMNSNNAGMESRLSGNNKHPSSASTGVPMPSPTTLLSKYYGLGLALNPNSLTSPSSFQKYEPPNLNTNTNKNPSKPRTTHNSAHNAKTRINGNNQNQHPFQPPTNNNQLQPSYFNVDEIAAMYPHQDFDILRQAVLRNDVTFTKFQGRAPESSLFPTSRSGINKFKNNSSRCSSSSPSPSPPDMSANRLSDIYPAQALELLRQQSEYVKLFQQAGINFPGLAADPAAYAADEVMKNKSKHAWVHPLLAQASATSGYQGLNGHRKTQPQEHVFVSPKIPTTSNKPKTVAAALAASRLSPNSLLSNMTGNMFEPLLAPPPSKRKPAIPAQRKRKPKVANQSNSVLARPDEDYLDPTSILEVTTSSGGSDGNNSINGVDRIGGAGNYPYMNGNHFMAPNLHSPNNHGFGESPASKLQKYLEQNNVSSPEASSPPNGETDQDKIKNLALQAFTYDPEVAGDARAVARKHGLNARVVMKWIKESSSKSFPMLNSGAGLDGGSAPLKMNGAASILEGIMASYMNSLEPNNLNVPNPTHKTNGDSNPGNHTFTPSSSNKRKNSKPNQICDFMQDDDDNVYGHEPVDMMIPIKKRRVSTQQ